MMNAIDFLKLDERTISKLAENFGLDYNRLNGDTVLSKANALFYYLKNDVGVTTVTGIIPNIRYFSYYNNPGLTDLRTEQENCLRDGCSDFVIVRSATTDTYPEFEQYDHLGSFVGKVDTGLINFHYYMRKQQ